MSKNRLEQRRVSSFTVHVSSQGPHPRLSLRNAWEAIVDPSTTSVQRRSCRNQRHADDRAIQLVAVAGTAHDRSIAIDQVLVACGFKSGVFRLIQQ